MCLFPLSPPVVPEIPRRCFQQEVSTQPLTGETQSLDTSQLVLLRTVLTQYQRYQNELVVRECVPLSNVYDLPFLVVKAHLQYALSRDTTEEAATLDPLLAQFLLLETVRDARCSLLSLLDAVPPEEKTLEDAFQWISRQHLSIQLRERRERLGRSPSPLC